uniref:Putative secreted protein ovary overexpressed n=1 Tax=Rhipicephalus microplus TaxID=6941 RepID=A0A6M2DAQ6_RHIMP
MMKKVALVLAVVLLCTEVRLMEAKWCPPGRSSNPASRPKPKPRKCGDTHCERYERCARQLVRVPTCFVFFSFFFAD